MSERISIAFSKIFLCHLHSLAQPLYFIFLDIIMNSEVFVFAWKKKHFLCLQTAHYKISMTIEQSNFHQHWEKHSKRSLQLALLLISARRAMTITRVKIVVVDNTGQRIQ